MNELVRAQLEAGEHTEAWDMQKLKGHLSILEHQTHNMDAEMYMRYLILCDRFRQRMQAVLGEAAYAVY